MTAGHTLISGPPVTVSARGELDVATVPSLTASFAAALAAAPDQCGGDHRIVLDLSAVTFMDSASLHGLVEMNARSARRGMRLHVVQPTAAGPRMLLALADAEGWIPVIRHLRAELAPS